MRLKLDENLPQELAAVLSCLGHEVDTVAAEGLKGALDAVVWDAASSEGRFFITQDLDFSDLRRFAPGSHPGLLLVRLHHPSRRRPLGYLNALFVSEDVSAWSGCFVVATDHKLRIRRPHR